MYQIRLHGRGGQGVVTAAEMLSVAAFMEGHHAQAFPSFGSERTGAPVVAFARIDSKEIRLREPILEPDVVLVQDPTLLEQVDVLSGLREDGYLLINSSQSIEELGLGELAARMPAGHVRTVPATRFAMEKIGRPLPGAAMLAGYAAMTGNLKLESVQAAYNEAFSGKIAEANSQVATLAYDFLIQTK
ncbi:MAG: 2-oxoacid:acceptor oxidoreductase family protein [Burkholderiaceae bacterium]|nr:2-oxoacid:acceptor oxidoreductase family protein [Burkholderiaceae bacterium]